MKHQLEKRPCLSLWALTALCAAGILDAAYLLFVHVFNAGRCMSGAGCETVLVSAYAKVGGVPLALLGLNMYLVLAWFSLDLLRHPVEKRGQLRWLVAVSLAGTVISGGLVALQGAVIGAWCRFCLVSALLTTGIFWLSLFTCKKEIGLARLWRLPYLKKNLVVVAVVAGVSWTIMAVGAKLADTLNPEGNASGDRIVARIADRSYTLDQVDRAIWTKLREIEETRYRERKAYLENLLLEKEAAQRSLSPRELIQKEVIPKIRVSEKEIEAFYQKNRSRLPNEPFDRLKNGIKNTLSREKYPSLYNEYISQLKERYGVVFSIPLPERLSIEANPQHSPERGPEDAKVTIVAFSDFQCPSCKNAHVKLNEAFDRYKGMLRLVFRHFPLPNHKQAPRAAEFSVCADGQGKFWPFADQIFEHQKELSETGLFEMAAGAGLDRSALDTCLRTNLGRETVEADLLTGKALGLDSTPSFFINGRFFSGLPGNLDEIIQEEIELARNN